MTNGISEMIGFITNPYIQKFISQMQLLKRICIQFRVPEIEILGISIRRN